MIFMMLPIFVQLYGLLFFFFQVDTWTHFVIARWVPEANNMDSLNILITNCILQTGNLMAVSV